MIWFKISCSPSLFSHPPDFSLKPPHPLQCISFASQALLNVADFNFCFVSGYISCLWSQCGRFVCIVLTWALYLKKDLINSITDITLHRISVVLWSTALQQDDTLLYCYILELKIFSICHFSCNCNPFYDWHGVMTSPPLLLRETYFYLLMVN